MNGINAYFWRVICAGMICALVGAIAPEGAGSRLRKLTAGIFLALAVLSPLGDLELPKLDLARIRSDARSAVQAGSEQAREAQNDIITETIEAYIWNKAAQLGYEVQVRVTLDLEGLPSAAELTGTVPEMGREALSGIIARELGLGREALTWIEPYQSSE